MKICPRCGSDNIDWIIPQNWSLWVCKTCNYTGPAIEGNETIALEIREDYIKKLEEEKEEIDENKQEDEESIEEELTDEEIEKKLDELMESD